MKYKVYLLDTGFACGGLVFDHMKCVECAPIFVKWFLGKTHGTCIQIIKNKKWKIQEVTDE